MCSITPNKIQEGYISFFSMGRGKSIFGCLNFTQLSTDIGSNGKLLAKLGNLFYGHTY